MPAHQLGWWVGSCSALMSTSHFLLSRQSCNQSYGLPCLRAGTFCTEPGCTLLQFSVRTADNTVRTIGRALATSTAKEAVMHAAQTLKEFWASDGGQVYVELLVTDDSATGAASCALCYFTLSPDTPRLACPPPNLPEFYCSVVLQCSVQICWLHLEPNITQRLCEAGNRSRESAADTSDAVKAEAEKVRY
jgi:hypothetical protein